MQFLLEKYNHGNYRKSTGETYMRIWRLFNKFIIKLDQRPKTWEEKAALFVAQLISNGNQSSSVKSYMSAIKKILVEDGYKWDDNKVKLSALTRTCKLVNDLCNYKITNTMWITRIITL